MATQKIWSVSYMDKGVYMTENVAGDTKTAAKAVITQRLKRQLKFKDVKHVGTVEVADG